MGAEHEYGMVIIGAGPAGQKAAIQAVKLGKKAAIVDANPLVGGACLHYGTIPSKSFREAILHLSGFRERSHYGKAYRVKQNAEMSDLTMRCDGIIEDVEQTIRSQLIRNNAEVVHGFASLIDPHHVRVKINNREQILSTESIVIATGTRPWHPPGFEFDHRAILDSDSVLKMERLPRTMSIVGGGVIGCEYGSMFAALGIKVTIVEAQGSLLGFVDRELVESLTFQLREQKASIILNDKVVRCSRAPDGRAVTFLESGKRIVTDVLLVSAGRVGNIEHLNLEGVGVEFDQRGRIKVNDHFQTAFPNVYAVGDVIGSPALASTALEQGRRAACHAFGLYDRGFDLPLPFGIYTIPEIGMIGKTEIELSAEKIPYETGIARFSEVERGKIIGDNWGVLKILFHRNTLQVLEVHIIGEGATELIHIGQTVMGFQGGIDYLAHAVFNYPTLAQSYKTAALDGMNKIMAAQGIPDEVPYQNLDLN